MQYVVRNTMLYGKNFSGQLYHVSRVFSTCRLYHDGGKGGKGGLLRLNCISAGSAVKFGPKCSIDVKKKILNLRNKKAD